MRRGIRLVGIKVVVKPNGRRYVYRRVGNQLVSLPDLPENDDRFVAAYLDAANVAALPKPIRAEAGTVGWLATRYMHSLAFSALAKGTRENWARIVKHIVKDRGAARVGGLRERHIRADLEGMAPVPANHRLKVWRAMLGFAVEQRIIPQSPAAQVKRRKFKSTPYPPWGIGQIEAFRNHYPIGSPPRTAFEIFWWSGARCCDVRRLSPAMVDFHGWLSFSQQKTGGDVAIPWACPLPEIWAPFAEDYELLRSSLAEGPAEAFILTEFGKPRSEKGLSQWFAEKARAALGDARFTAHGLRKSRAIAIIEIGGTPHQVGAWTGHDSLKEIEDYTKGASKRRLLGFRSTPQPIDIE